MLQLAQQTVLPQVIAIHQNNSEHPYSWAAKDVIKRLMAQGVKFEAKFTKGPIHHPDYHIWPLSKLIDHDCDVYMKLDHDDFFYDFHIERLTSFLKDDYEMVINKTAHYLTLPFMQDFRFQAEVDFGRINPLGGMSDACCFTKKFAEEYLRDLQSANAGAADDVVMIKTRKKFKTLQIDIEPTACWVSHWTNDSSALLVADEYAINRGFVHRRYLETELEELRKLKKEKNIMFLYREKGEGQPEGNVVGINEGKTP